MRPGGKGGGGWVTYQNIAAHRGLTVPPYLPPRGETLQLIEALALPLLPGQAGPAPVVAGHSEGVAQQSGLPPSLPPSLPPAL